MLFFAACRAPEPLPTPALQSVTPGWIDTVAGGVLTFSVQGFVPKVKVDLDESQRSQVLNNRVSGALVKGETRVTLAGAFLRSSNEVSATVPPGTAQGIYDLELQTPTGETLTLAQAVEVLDCASLGCTPCDGPHYRDFDGDGVGQGFPQALCGARWVSPAGDCDDTDVLTAPNQPEVCNGIDDDCDGAVDDGVCVSKEWTQRASLGSAPLFDVDARTSATWVASPDALLQLQAAGAQSFTGCPQGLNLVAVDASGQVEVSGPSGVASPSGGTTCMNVRPTEQPLVGLAAAGNEFFGVSASGQLYRWSWGGAPERYGSGSVGSASQVLALDGTSRDALFAVGVTQSGNFRRATIWRAKSDGSWTEENVGIIAGALTTVWVNSGSDAYAAGESGLVFRRDARGWNTVPYDVSATIAGIRGFSQGRIYVVEREGQVRRFAMQKWETLFRSRNRINAFSGAREDALTAVGELGLVVEGPR